MVKIISSKPLQCDGRMNLLVFHPSVTVVSAVLNNPMRLSDSRAVDAKIAVALDNKFSGTSISASPTL